MNIQSIDPARFVQKVNAAIESGLVLKQMYSQLCWSAWRFVRVYTAEFTRQPVATLELEFGPVAERDLPEPSEGDCDVSIN